MVFLGRLFTLIPTHMKDAFGLLKRLSMDALIAMLHQLVFFLNIVRNVHVSNPNEQLRVQTSISVCWKCPINVGHRLVRVLRGSFHHPPHHDKPFTAYRG
jgi:hypothetical protein